MQLSSSSLPCNRTLHWVHAHSPDELDFVPELGDITQVHGHTPYFSQLQRTLTELLQLLWTLVSEVFCNSILKSKN